MLSVRLLKAEPNILIRPKCILIPKVKEISPVFESYGCDQDSPVIITFNKAVNPESFTSPKVIKFTSGSENFNDYYEEPYFSKDNTQLIFTPDKTKRIISQTSSLSYRDITLSMDFGDAVDADGIKITAAAAYTYRLNKSTDNDPPVLEEADLFTCADTDDPLFRQLSETDFDNWQDQDYHTNHTADSVYIKLKGYDLKSGIKAVRISETYYRSIDGNEAGTCVTNDCDFSGEGENLYSLTYRMKTLTDGVIKLEVSLLDWSDNTSSPKTFYVLKDTIIEADSLNFEECKQDYEDRRTVSDGTDTVTLTPSSQESSDVFYKGYSTPLDIELYWGYSKDSAGTKVEKGSDGKFEFVRNASRLVYVKLVCSDAAGNCRELKRIIPPLPDFDKNSVLNDSIYPYNYASYKSLEDSGQSSFETLYCIKKPASTNGGDFSSVIDLQNSGTEDICKVYVQTLFNYGGRTFWRSPLSTKYFEVKKDSSGDLTYTLVSPVNSISSVSSDFSPYLKNGVSLTAQPLHSTGTYKVTISGYAPEGTDTQNVKYTFKFKKSQAGIYSVSTEETVYLESPADYTLTIEAEAPDGTLYQPCKDSHFDIYLNGSDTSLQDGVLNLTEDLTPPSFTQRSWSPYCSTEAAATFYNMCLPGYFSDGYIDLYTADDGDGDGMYETESGLGLLTYYFIPNSLSSVSECSAFTFEELENSYSAYKKTMTYDLNAKEIKIPYDGLEEGFYPLCEVVKDKNENYAVRCVPAFNKMLGRQIDEKPHKKETLPYYRYFYYE